MIRGHRKLTIVLLLPLLIEAAPLRAESWLFVSLLEERQIVAFQRDAESGQLIRRATTDCPAEPACLSVSPDRRTLFASFRSSGQLASFRIVPGAGELEAISIVAGGEDPAFLQPDRTGRFLLSAYYAGNKVAVHRVGSDGALSREPAQTVFTADKAHGVAIDSKNAAVFVPHTGANRIFQFRFDSRTGRLAASDPPFLDCPPGRHPRHLAIEPKNRWAYGSDEAGDSVSAYRLDPQTATLQHLQTLSTLPEEFDGARNATARCELTPDGRFVYVANRGHDSIAGFAIDQVSGRLTPLGQTPTEPTPRSFTIEPRGRFLYAAGQSSGKIAAFRIASDGGLTRFATYPSGPVSWWTLAVDTQE